MSILIFAHAFLYFHTRRTAKTGLQCHTISSLQPAARQPAMASIACCSPRSQAARDGFNCAAARAARDGLNCLLQPAQPSSPRWLQLPAAARAARDGFNCAAARAARDGLSCLLQPGSTPCLQLLQRATCAGRWNDTVAPRQAYY